MTDRDAEPDIRHLSNRKRALRGLVGQYPTTTGTCEAQDGGGSDMREVVQRMVQLGSCSDFWRWEWRVGKVENYEALIKA